MPVIPAEEAVAIVERLVERTQAKTLRWATYLDEVAEYKAETTRFIYYIKARDDDDNAPYVLELWRKLEGTNNVRIADIETQMNSPVNPLLSLLYEAAKFSAFGIESLTNDILEDLE